MFSRESFIIRRQCTPFCEAKCKYAGQHHKILVAVINCVDDREYSEFTKTITKFTKQGWNIDDPIEDPDPEFRYPLVHWAAVLGNVIVLKWCAEQGLDLNKRWGQRSETALHRLMVCGYSALRENSENLLKTFKKLVKLLKGLLYLKDDNKDLPIHVAAKVLVERPLINDSRFDRTYIEMLKILIQTTCESDSELINCRNIEGNTVMHIVAQHDKGAEILELLLENGADCDLPNSEGLRPIDIAKSKDATDIIAVIVNNDGDPKSSEQESSFKNKEDLRADEIGDIEYIYVESDDDMDNSDEKNEIYIRNLLDQNDLDKDSNTMEDTNDPDWNATNLDASSSNDTLFTLDEESYDSDGPLAALHDARSTLTHNDLEESSCISEKDKQHVSRPQTPDLKRKSFETETVLLQPETKKLKALNVQGKESKMVSPKLEIQLNMPKFESLKRKIKEETAQGEKVAKTLFFFRSSPDVTIQNMENNGRFSPNDEVFVQQECSPTRKKETSSSTSVAEESHAVEIVIEGSNEETEISPSISPRTLPGMCTDGVVQVHDHLTNSFSAIKEPLTAKNMFSSSDEVPQIQSSDEEESVTPDLQHSFSSSAETRSAWQRLHGEKTVQSSGNLNRSQLSQLFDILEPVKTRTERAVATSTPNPLTVVQSCLSQDFSSSAHEPTKQQLSSSSLQTMEHQRLSPSPVLSGPHHSSQCTTSLPTDQIRSKKSIEDVVSSLKERQRTDSFESLSSTESNSTQEQVNGKRCSSTEQQAATTTSTQADENDFDNDEQSEKTEEKQGQLTRQEQSSRSSTPVTKKDEENSEIIMFPSSDQQLSQDTKKPESPISNITVIKKEVDDSECGEKLLDGYTKIGQTSMSSLVRSHSREGEINKTAVSLTKQLNEPQEISRNASPTQIQPGSYQAMNGTSTDTSGSGASTDTSGSGTSTDTSGSGTSTDMSGSGASTDTSGIGSGTSTDTSGSGTTYQPSSSLTGQVEKLCEEVTNVSCSLSTPGNNAGKTDSNYDPLYSVIDKFCEEVYGISSGPQTNSGSRNTSSKQGDCVQNNATQLQKLDSFTQSHLATTSTPVHEQESLPIQSTTTVQKQPEGALNIKIKHEPGLENAQNKGQIMAQAHTPAASQVLTGTTHEQMVSVQSQPTLLPATQPAQTIVQGPVQVPSFMLVSKQLVQTVGQDTSPTYIALQTQAQPSQPSRMLMMQGSRPIQVATQGAGHVTQLQLVAQQPQTQGQFIRLQHLPETPQFQGSVRAQQPGVLTPGQGHIPVGLNRPVLQHNPVLTHLLHRNFRGMINRVSRTPAMLQNVNVGINQQNATRPPTVMRLQVPSGGERSQSIPWNKQNLTQFPQKQGIKNGNTSPVYIRQSNQLVTVKSAIQALTESLNSKARQPTLEEAKRYLLRRSNVPQVRSNPLEPSNQRPILAPRPNQANLLAPPVQTAHQTRSLLPTTTQLRSGDASVSVQVRTLNGRPVVSRVTGPDMETAMANRINMDPTTKTTRSSNSPASVISVESPANRSNVFNSQPSGNGLNHASSNVSLATGERSRGTTPLSNQPSPQPPSGRSSVDNQSQAPIQARANVNNQSELPLQASGSDTNNPDESEDEGLGLNGFSESDSVRDMFKDISGTKKVLEKLGQLIPKEDMLQLLEKAKISHKEQIDKWTNEYEAAARCERHKYLELENLREKIERERENARQLYENIVKWKKEAEKVKTEKVEAANKKRVYQNKIAEENEKIPVLNECINLFANQGSQ